MVSLLHTSGNSLNTVEGFRKKSVEVNSYLIQDVSPLRRLRSRISFAILAALLFTMTLVCHRGQPFKAIKISGTHQTLDTISQNPLDSIDWSKFAYVQYVTNRDYLCNSVMLFEVLSRLGSKADRVMLYPFTMELSDKSAEAAEDVRLLKKARDEYNVRLQPVELQHRDHSNPTWADSFTKLLVFNQTQYTRVLSLDSDSTVLQSMDELFLLPPCPVAMPHAYWLEPENRILSSQLMLVQPSTREFKRVMSAAFNDQGSWSGYDMDVLNKLYKDQAVVLPHRPYNLLTGEFRAEQHNRYLGSDAEPWDPVAVLNEAKFLHFSDWPAPKPWIEMPEPVRKKMQPKCEVKDEVEHCVERDLWNGFYEDFAHRRERVCKSQRLQPVRRSSAQSSHEVTI